MARVVAKRTSKEGTNSMRMVRVKAGLSNTSSVGFVSRAISKDGRELVNLPDFALCGSVVLFVLRAKVDHP